MMPYAPCCTAKDARWMWHPFPANTAMPSPQSVSRTVYALVEGEHARVRPRQGLTP
jgi:hypothetical protein